MAITGQHDVYDKLTYRLMYPVSKTLRRIFELRCTLEEAQVLAELPAPSADIAKKLSRDKATVDRQIEELFFKGVVRLTPTPQGQYVYDIITPIEPSCDNMLWVIGAHYFNEHTRQIEGEVNREIADLWNKFFEEEWYRWERVSELVHRRVAMVRVPGYTFTIFPAWKALEKSGCDVPEFYWDARQVAKKAKRILVGACTCRVRARKCDAPIYTCTVFEGLMPGAYAITYEQEDRKAIRKAYSPEQWLETLAKCEELGMLHTGFVPLPEGTQIPILSPFGCTCDPCCCCLLVPLMRYAKLSEGFNKSPYRAVVSQEACDGCPQCVTRCRFEAIKIKEDPSTGQRKAFVDIEKCFGCGQCVVGCQKPGALKLELAERIAPPSSK